MSREARLIQLTAKIAELSAHRFQIGAIVARGSRIISMGVNKYKTHPLQKNHHTNDSGGSIHAELDALLKVHPAKRKGSQIYVVRLLADGSFGNAEPCKFCKDLLITAGIYCVVHSVADGHIKKDLRYD